MNRMHQSMIAIVAVAFGGLLGCSKKPPPKVEDTVFGDTVAAKERARTETEKAMEQNKQKLEEAMKKNEAAAGQ
jgi:hypothetical protein